MHQSDSVAAALLSGLGGSDNVLKLENCMTRVRVEVVDDRRVDIDAIKRVAGVKGYIMQGRQHQLIAGPGAAAKIVDAMRRLLPNAPGESPVIGSAHGAAQTRDRVKTRYATPVSGALRQLADVFIPLIPAFIASGLITGLINLLTRADVSGDIARSYPNVLGLLALFGSAVFAIMNILVGVNAARVFGGSQAMGGVMAAILSSPGLAQIRLFDEPLQPGRGGVIAVLLVVALMCWVEKALRRHLPESIELIVNPLLTTLITASLAIVVLQPLGGAVSDAIAHGVNVAIDRGGVAVGALLAGSFLPLVLTGLHQGMVPLHVELIQSHGVNPLLPILAMAGVGQVGASFAVLVKTRSARLKKVVRAALPVGLLGIGEPLIFGVTLPLGRPFVAACLGGAVGGAVISYLKVATLITFGLSGLPLALTIVTGKIAAYLAGWAAAIAAGFIFTWLIGFNDPEE
ncbi:PTS transporter subunit EIIC [Sodalis endosymbiont of Spalangia cameroni]|uniref:PTS transporter subunit EIIC n=1 Tax=Sodalis praecaptivus TaxID=1239307 RepID=UPI0031F869AD